MVCATTKMTVSRQGSLLYKLLGFPPLQLPQKNVDSFTARVWGSNYTLFLMTSLSAPCSVRGDEGQQTKEKEEQKEAQRQGSPSQGNNLYLSNTF